MKKLVFYLIVAVIFFFLGKALFGNWQKIKEYQFSFNYLYLVISWIFPILTITSFAFIWNKILRMLDPQNKISHFKALKIFIYSWFGRYLPGKVWQPLGHVYLGRREGLSSKSLTISVIFANVLFLVSSSFVSLVFLSVALGSQLLSFYYVAGAVMAVGGLIFVQPRIFYPILNRALRVLKKEAIGPQFYLNYQQILTIILLYSFAFILSGVGFFFLINSITYLPLSAIIGVIGILNMAGVLGIVAVFAPSGLGVREGVMAGLLQFYFPVGVAVLISLVARIWATLPELILLAFIYFCPKREGCEVGGNVVEK